MHKYLDDKGLRHLISELRKEFNSGGGTAQSLTDATFRDNLFGAVELVNADELVRGPFTYEILEGYNAEN